MSSQFGGRLERLFGITGCRVDPGLTSVGFEQLGSKCRGASNGEQQVGRNLTITYVSNVSSTQEQVIQVEYDGEPEYFGGGPAGSERDVWYRLEDQEAVSVGSCVGWRFPFWDGGGYTPVKNCVVWN